MRINDRLLVQMHTDTAVVVIDESSGQEHELAVHTIPEWANRLAAITEAGRERSLFLAPSGIRINSPEAAKVSFALGYFWGLATERGNHR